MIPYLLHIVDGSIITDGTVAPDGLYLDHLGPGLFDPTAQYIVAAGICLCLILAGAGLLIWTLRTDKGKW